MPCPGVFKHGLSGLVGLFTVLLNPLIFLHFSANVAGGAEQTGPLLLVQERVGAGEKAGKMKVPIWWEFQTEPEKFGEKPDDSGVKPPLTEVFLVLGRKPEEKMRIGRYMGDPYIHEDLKGSHLPREARHAILSCWTWYAGGGDELFVFQRGQTLEVKWRPIGEGMDRPAQLKTIMTKKLGSGVELEGRK
jgi:hypothetical protein